MEKPICSMSLLLYKDQRTNPLKELKHDNNSDGKMIGAHLDRNGFRPCRWAKTSELFVLGSEAGCFELDEKDVIAKGALSAGESVKVNTTNGSISFKDPSIDEGVDQDYFNPRLKKLNYLSVKEEEENLIEKQVLFGLGTESRTNS